MSKIGKQPITIPKEVTVTIKGNEVIVKGTNGELSYTLPDILRIAQEEDVLQVSIHDTSHSQGSALSGLARSIVQNNITGVSKGFVKKLQIIGVGYKAQVQGNKLVMQLGYSHPITYEAPKGIAFTVENDIINVSGADKQLVGQVAAEIRAFRKPEPYKGKGIRYVDEYVRRKSGKVAGGASESAG